MTHDQFTTEYLRLHRGFSAEAEITPERMQAAFDRWGWMPASCLADAVSRALTDARIPHSDVFDRYLDDAHGAFLERERQQSDRDAKRFLTEEPPHTESSREWVVGHYRAIMLLLNHQRTEARELLHSIGSPAFIPDPCLSLSSAERAERNGYNCYAPGIISGKDWFTPSEVRDMLGTGVESRTYRDLFTTSDSPAAPEADWPQSTPTAEVLP